MLCEWSVKTQMEQAKHSFCSELSVTLAPLLSSSFCDCTFYYLMRLDELTPGPNYSSMETKLENRAISLNPKVVFA